MLVCLVRTIPPILRTPHDQLNQGIIFCLGNLYTRTLSFVVWNYWYAWYDTCAYFTCDSTDTENTSSTKQMHDFLYLIFNSERHTGYCSPPNLEYSNTILRGLVLKKFFAEEQRILIFRWDNLPRALHFLTICTANQGMIPLIWSPHGMQSKETAITKNINADERIAGLSVVVVLYT